MTHEEAVKQLEFLSEMFYGPVNPSQEAINIAIDALKKEIPQVPEYDCHIGESAVESEDYFKCPNCSADLNQGRCPECGQAIDWEKVL